MRKVSNWSSKIMSNRGDTIVEVLIAIAIVTVVLASGYALSNYSLQSGIGSSQRNEALAGTEGQIEFLRNAKISEDEDLLKKYKEAGNFCINQVDGEPLPANSEACKKFPDGNGNYAVSISYNEDSKVFTVNSLWQGRNRGEEDKDKDNLTLYYKLPDPFAQSSTSTTSSGGSTSTSSSTSSTSTSTSTSTGSSSTGNSSTGNSSTGNSSTGNSSFGGSPPECFIYGEVWDYPNLWVSINGNCTGGTETWTWTQRAQDKFGVECNYNSSGGKGASIPNVKGWRIIQRWNAYAENQNGRGPTADSGDRVGQIPGDGIEPCGGSSSGGSSSSSSSSSTSSSSSSGGGRYYQGDHCHPEGQYGVLYEHWSEPPTHVRLGFECEP